MISVRLKGRVTCVLYLESIANQANILKLVTIVKLHFCHDTITDEHQYMLVPYYNNKKLLMIPCCLLTVQYISNNI